uniref:Leucine-zipper-like transcriptional regulator 1 n=1 Tax=Macrostomum lignano TaxID=282301 RepID=A0A1I8HKN1_9PLAT
EWHLVWPSCPAGQLSDTGSDGSHGSTGLTSIHSDSNSSSDAYFGPSARFGHTACAHDCGMYVFGGYGGLYLCQPDLWRWSFRIGQWSRIRIPTDGNQSSSGHVSELTANGGPQAVAFHSACIVQGHMLIFGGETRDQRTTDQLWSLRLTSETWTPVRSVQQQRQQRPRGTVHHSLLSLFPHYTKPSIQQVNSRSNNEGREFESSHYNRHQCSGAEIELATIRQPGGGPVDAAATSAADPVSWAFANPSLSVSSSCGSTVGGASAASIGADDNELDAEPAAVDGSGGEFGASVLCLGAQETGFKRSPLAIWRGCFSLT